MYASLVSSSITIGFGGSVGAEGPIVFTGAAIGSNLGQAFRLSPKILMILVGCGAAAGIAGIFRAPIAGMLFTLEVLMIDLTGTTIMPLLLSSIAGATVAYVMEGYSAEFFFVQSEPFLTRKIPYTILLGVFTGLVSLYFTLVATRMESLFGKMKQTWMKVLAGGSLLALLIFLFPPLFGEGYDAINNLLNGDTSSIVNGTLFYVDRHEAWFSGAFRGLRSPDESLRHKRDKRSRRSRRHVCPLALRRRDGRIPFRFLLPTRSARDRNLQQEFRPARHGRCDERGQ